jgi:hypothetical protein
MQTAHLKPAVQVGKGFGQTLLEPPLKEVAVEAAAQTHSEHFLAELVGVVAAAVKLMQQELPELH